MITLINHLSGEKDGPEVDKQDMGGGGRVAWAQDRDDVRDPQQWDDHQQGLCLLCQLLDHHHRHHHHDSTFAAFQF